MRVKNNKETSDTWCGQLLEAAAEHDIEAIELAAWRSSDKVMSDLASGDLSIGDGLIYKNSGAQAINYLLGTSQEVLVSSQPPFAAKTLPNGKKLYTRVHGVAASVSGAPDDIIFTVPYAACKLTGIEIIGGQIGDTVNLKVLDSTTGTYTGVANYQLNQFGYDVNVAKDFYSRESAYDADLFQGMQIKVEYDSVATLPANVYLNFILHEVKD